jgi:putative flippase GtrA
VSPLLRQGAQFLAVGLVLIAVDSAVYVGLTAAGMATVVANPLARIAGAALGYVLNGRITFAGVDGPVLGRAVLLRFVGAWLLLTLASTLALDQIALRAGLQHAWWAKPLVEALLAAISFFLSRHWVYRR